MSDDSDRPMSEEKTEAEQAPAGPQSEGGVESDETDLLLEQRSTPELRRWLRSRYPLV